VKRTVLFLILMLLPAALFAGGFFQPIPMAEVARLMNRPRVALLDVNVQEVWEKHHLPGAVHIDSADIARFLPADKRATLIFYCAGPMCEASGLAADESVMLGYRQVYVMRDGIFGWVKAGYPVVASSPAKGQAPAVTHGHGDSGHEHHN